VLTTPYGGMRVDTFDGSRPGWIWSGDADIVTGSLSGRYAAPYNSGLMNSPDDTRYLTLPKASDLDGIGSASVTFGGASYNYLGLFWGSIDTYNTIGFLSDDNVVASFTGSDVYRNANGNQSAPPTNRYMNFIDMPDFDEVRFTSTQFAFEIDNVAAGATPVPLPTSLLLLGAGLASLAGLRRKWH
jgi:hypothetical protein